jgi:L-ascorbate metabolism protein UlaG (beta-lactamase superfamily)
MRTGVTVTWLGHSTFLIKTPEGKTILVDPWLAGNPRCPEGYADLACDAILLTHGHFDHTGDAVSAAGRCRGPVVAIFELATWLQGQGVPESKVVGMNKGGSLTLDDLGVKVTMTDARHSSSAFDKDGRIVYLGEPAGFVLRFSNDFVLYIAGDTCLFGDMQWIATLHAPRAAILPIGDLYTMDPRAAAHACKLLGIPAVIPCHWGTFPALTGTPDALRSELKALGCATEVHALEPGETASFLS